MHKCDICNVMLDSFLCHNSFIPHLSIAMSQIYHVNVHNVKLFQTRKLKRISVYHLTSPKLYGFMPS